MLFTEYRRGAGIVLTPVTAVLSWLSVYGMDDPWPGPWATLAEDVHSTLFVVGPVVLAFAVWQASRERRRGTSELLGTTPRAPWRRVVLSWASVALGGVLGVLVPLLVGAVLVAWHGGYAGGGWWWLLLITFLGIGFTAAIGTVIGVLVPVPLLGLLAGVTCYITASQLAKSHEAGVTGLLPQTPYSGHWMPREVRWGPHMIVVLWFVVGTVALLALAAARRRRLAAIPVAGATVLAVVISGFTVDDYVVEDQRALELVCRDQVCLRRADAHALEAITEMVKPLLDKVAGIPGAPTSAKPDRTGHHLDVSGGVRVDWAGAPMYTHEVYFQQNLVNSVINPWRCGVEVSRGFTVPRVAAKAWWTGDRSVLDEEPRAADLLDRLTRLDEAAQRAWIGQYLDAVHRCDSSAVAVIP